MPTPCPHCGEKEFVPNRTRRYADTYLASCLSVTLCCEKGIKVTPIRSYRVEAYSGSKLEDDWGIPFKL